jgi:dTDP-4-dehydrorhamnose 3,5-epimerase
MVYKVSQPYAVQCEGGVVWNDPELGIEWPGMDRLVISEKDRSLPNLSGFASPFEKLGAPTAGGYSP